MDTTEVYTKMCDCEEIQELFRTLNPDLPHITATQHDYIYCPKHKSLWTLRHSGYLCRNYEPCGVTGIWLPRQDQLQEMAWDIGAGYSSWFNVLKDFYGFTSTNPSAKPLSSMEQLWMGFYMSEKHNKIWEGEKWKVVVEFGMVM